MRSFGLVEVLSRSAVSRKACLVRSTRSSNKCKCRLFGLFWPPWITGFPTFSPSSEVFVLTSAIMTCAPMRPFRIAASTIRTALSCLLITLLVIWALEYPPQTICEILSGVLQSGQFEETRRMEVRQLFPVRERRPDPNLIYSKVKLWRPLINTVLNSKILLKTLTSLSPWIASKASVGTGLGPSWSKILYLYIISCVSLNKWQRMSKPGPGCGCLLSARPMWSPTPRPNYPLMTSNASCNSYAYVSIIISKFFMRVSVIPACNSSCVMSCTVYRVPWWLKQP